MSRSRMFLVAVDILDPTFDRIAIRRLLRDNDAVKGWWNHIPGCFLIETDRDAEELTDTMREATKQARLLVMEVRPDVSEGWLPEQSWEWIRKRETEDAR